MVANRILVVTRQEVWGFDRGGSPVLVGRLPHARTGFGCCGLGRKLYLVGGRREGARRDDGALLTYDLAAGTWSRGTPLPRPVSRPAVVAIGGLVHVLGGLQRRLVFVRTSDAHHAYDVRTREWLERPWLPSKRFAAMAAAGRDGSIHVFGGHGAWRFGRAVLSDHYSHAPATSNWVREEPLPRGRSSAAVGSTSAEIIVAGGEDARGPIGSALAFDLVRRLWTALPAPAHAAGGAVAWSTGETVGIVGAARDGSLARQMMTPTDPYEVCVPA